MALKEAMNEGLGEPTNGAGLKQLGTREACVDLKAAKDSTKKHIPSFRRKAPGGCNGGEPTPMKWCGRTKSLGESHRVCRRRNSITSSHKLVIQRGGAGTGSKLRAVAEPREPASPNTLTGGRIDWKQGRRRERKRGAGSARRDGSSIRSCARTRTSPSKEPQT